MPPKKKEPAVEETKIVTAKSQLTSFLNTNKEDHYQFEKPIDVLVSSGSLLFDAHIGGGIGPGLHRFTGTPEGGKSSCALSFMKNFLAHPFKRRGLLIKAEGRLSQQIQERSGVKFTFDSEEWEDGTCFVFESNVYETVIDLLRDLVKKNDEGIQYFFMLDSVDGLILRNDLVKETDESNKVAGGAVLAATLMKKMAIALQKRGHVAIFISQVRANVQLDPYSKEPVRQTTATGGNALLHFANFIFEFQPRFSGDVILENPDEKQHTSKNPPIGHLCNLIIKKSPNETSGLKIQYPIKYGRKNGTSNWVEREIFDLLIRDSCLVKKGAWLFFEEDFLNDAKVAGVEIPEKIHGISKFNTLVENDEKIKNYLISYCRVGASKNLEQEKECANS